MKILKVLKIGSCMMHAFLYLERDTGTYSKQNIFKITLPFTNRTLFSKETLAAKYHTMIGWQMLYRLILKILCLLFNGYFKRKDRILSTIASFPIFFKHLYFLFSPLGSSFYFSTSSPHSIFFSLFTLNFISIPYQFCDL